MKLWSDSFEPGARIPQRYAMGKHNAETHAEPSDNVNPHLAWSDLPAGTVSLALICVDASAPTSPENVNKPGVTVPASLPRADFYHWALVDLPADAGPIAEGEFCRGLTPKGKDASSPRGRQGINDYTMWFEGDADMAGDYYGYDGPWPPFNDEIAHQYTFTLYALDVDKVDVDGRFPATAVLAAIEGHILGQASIAASYAINPDV